MLRYFTMNGKTSKMAEVTRKQYMETATRAGAMQGDKLPEAFHSTELRLYGYVDRSHEDGFVKFTKA